MACAGSPAKYHQEMSGEPGHSRNAHSVAQREPRLQIGRRAPLELGRSLQARVLSRRHPPDAEVAASPLDQRLLARTPARGPQTSADVVAPYLPHRLARSRSAVGGRMGQPGRPSKCGDAVDVDSAQARNESCRPLLAPPRSVGRSDRLDNVVQRIGRALRQRGNRQRERLQMTVGRQQPRRPRRTQPRSFRAGATSGGRGGEAGDHEQAGAALRNEAASVQGPRRRSSSPARSAPRAWPEGRLRHWTSRIRRRSRGARRPACAPPSPPAPAGTPPASRTRSLAVRPCRPRARGPCRETTRSPPQCREHPLRAPLGCPRARNRRPRSSARTSPASVR